MLFNSFSFLIFFPVVTFIYFIIPHKYRCALLLMASCYFYMAFIPAYITILFLTILIDYLAARLIVKANGGVRKAYLIVSIISTCSVLFYFKYFNFFNDNISLLARAIDWNYPVSALSIILPIGLSFHTFQSLSYVIDVYRGEQEPEKDLGIYSLFVMFYPQLVAGPIERARNLLSQLREEHKFDYDMATGGLRLMLWGLFKKVVIADRLAIYVNSVYGHAEFSSGLSLILATYFFAIQIYCDFSGYSDMAIGAARVMGFRLKQNFDHPYFAKSISEFWHRWHISLSTWFRDYVYIPLGGNRLGRARTFLNLLLVFLISGFWHGADWKFVIWGGLFGIYIIASSLTCRHRKWIVGALAMKRCPMLHDFVRMFVTFNLVSFAWIFFRADSVSGAYRIIAAIFKPTLSMGEIDFQFVYCVAGVAILFIVEIWQQKGPALDIARPRGAALRWGVYLAMLLTILLIGVFDGSQFIYFQF